MESNSSGKKPPPPINRGPRWSSRIRSYYVNRISTEGRGREKGWMIGWSSRGEILLKDTFGWFARFSTLFIARMWEGWFQEIGFDPWREIWNFNFRLVALFESRNFPRDDSRSNEKKEIFSFDWFIFFAKRFHSLVSSKYVKIERWRGRRSRVAKWSGEINLQFAASTARVVCKKWRAGREVRASRGAREEENGVEREYETCSRGNRNHILNFHKRVRRATPSSPTLLHLHFSAPSFTLHPILPRVRRSPLPPFSLPLSLFLCSSKRSFKLRKHISFILLPRSRLCHSAHPLDPSRAPSS